jgi:hypothetical protein
VKDKTTKAATAPNLTAEVRRRIAEIKAAAPSAPSKLIVEFGPDPLLIAAAEFWRRTRARRYW